MGWIDDEGQHEGFVVVRFADAVVGSGQAADGGAALDADSTGRRLPVDPARPGRAWSEVVGWQMACVCAAYPDPEGASIYDSRQAEILWLSDPPLVRVRTPELDDVAAGRVYADDQDVEEIDRVRKDVEAVLLAAWHRHLGPAQRVRAVRDASDRARASGDELDAAVVAARRDGVQWAQIGAAAGMTRQSAHQRWSALCARAGAGDRAQAPA